MIGALPYGKQLAPAQIELDDFIGFILKNEPNRSDLEDDIRKRFFAKKNQSETLAMNAFLSARSYGLVEDDGSGYKATPVTHQLDAAASKKALYDGFAAHIILGLHGLTVINVV